MANDSNDRWADLELRETDEEYIAFLQQLNAEVLGQYTPGESPVLFPPLQTQNGFPQATLMHEETHQELMLTTTFGQFTLLLKTLTKVGPFKTEFSMCLKNQWQAHEGAATYAGLTVIANRGREEFEQEVNRLPSRDRGRSPYLELFEFVSRFLPIVPCSGQSRLKAQAATVTALAQCSLNTDCFVRFADPQSLTVKALHQYLIENSPGSRFQKICRALGADQIQRLAVELEEFLNSGQENPSPGVFVKRRVAASIPQLSFVVEFEEIKAQHRTFCAAWSGKVLELTGEPLELTPRGAQPFEIPQRSGALDIKPMTLPHFARVLQRCVDDGYGLWAVVYMEDKGKLKLDVFPYRMDVARNPKPEEEAIRKFLDHGFLSGVYEPTGVVSLLRQFPSVPLAITFVKWSWFFLERGGGKSISLAKLHMCLPGHGTEQGIDRGHHAFPESQSRRRVFPN